MPTAQQPLPPNEDPGRDPLPEQLEWRDSGCSVAPRCLACPLPRCRYDDPGGLRGILNEYRDLAVVRARRSGRDVNSIAGEFDISRRTVFRILRRAGYRDRDERCGPKWRTT